MVSTDVSQFDLYRFNLLVAKIKNTKASYDSDLSDMDTYLKGWRYENDDRIARIVIGDIYEECGFDIEKAKEKFLNLDSSEIEPYIKTAVLDSASSDHWYTYEKVW